MKILILKSSSLGDVVQAIPVLRLLKRAFPRSEIHWWIDSKLRSLLEGDPDLSGVFLFERQRWSSPIRWNELVADIRRMRNFKFDWVLDLQSLARSGLFAWLANGGLTIGLDDHREGARGFYDIAVPRPGLLAHAVDWYLEVPRRLGVPVHDDFIWLPVRPEAEAAVKDKGWMNSARWVVLQPGARWGNKRWPAEYFAELVRRLSDECGDLRFVVLGGADDTGLGEIIARAEPSRCLDLTGQTSLSEMIEWIRLSDLMVTNDTGPMHVAAALAKPVVALFGPTEPRRTGPYGQVSRVIRVNSLSCVPCLKDTCSYQKPFECLRGISPEAVTVEVRRRLAEMNRVTLRAEGPTEGNDHAPSMSVQV